MVIKTSHEHMFELIMNTKNAFYIESFNNKYLPEYFEIYDYLVGDISGGILRLKGFIKKNNEKQTLLQVNEYLDKSCSLRCPTFILRRITEEEFEKLSKNPRKIDTHEEKTPVLEKENFDKESLILQSTPSVRPNIIIDPKKINGIPKGLLPLDLKETIKEEKNNRLNDNKNNNFYRNNKINNNSNNKQSFKKHNNAKGNSNSNGKSSNFRKKKNNKHFNKGNDKK